MTTDSRDAPSGESSFAEVVRDAEDHVRFCDKFGLGGQSDIAQLLACIREQQAALEAIILRADNLGHAEGGLDGLHELEQSVDLSRAVLAKWRIE